MRFSLLIPAFGALLGVLFTAPASAQPQDVAEVRAPRPVLVTSAGQALDAFTVKTLIGREGIDVRYDQRVEADQIGDAQTLIIAMGASIKGFGEAGITAESETQRTRELIEAAEKNGIFLIGVHIGGKDRRGGLSETFVVLVSPASDYLVVWEDGNQDGYFTEVAAENRIPITIVEQPLKVGAALAEALAE